MVTSISKYSAMPVQTPQRTDCLKAGHGYRVVSIYIRLVSLQLYSPSHRRQAGIRGARPVASVGNDHRRLFPLASFHHDATTL